MLYNTENRQTVRERITYIRIRIERYLYLSHQLLNYIYFSSHDVMYFALLLDILLYVI